MRRATSNIIANPVMVGAATALVVVVGVFLAYNANKGLPFIPTFQFRVEVPDASRLVIGNDVREGGMRIGQVTKLDPVHLKGGKTGAELTLQLSKKAIPIPADSVIVIRPRSALGSKFVEIIRGRSRKDLAPGTVLRASEAAIQVEPDDVFDMFPPPPRRAIRTNLDTFGGGLVTRGQSINRTLAALPTLLGNLPPVMRPLAAPSTRLAPTIEALARTASAVAPVAGPLARGFSSGDDVFGALSRDPRAPPNTIAESPATLDVAHESLRVQRPFL